MICLRCGYCCKESVVHIVKDPELGWSEDNLTLYNGINSGGKKQCPHLRGAGPGSYYCSLHNCKWYEHTPCARYNEKKYGKDEICEEGISIMDAVEAMENRLQHFIKYKIIS